MQQTTNESDDSGFCFFAQNLFDKMFVGIKFAKDGMTFVAKKADGLKHPIGLKGENYGYNATDCP